MRKITEIIIHPNLTEETNMSLANIVTAVRANLGVFNVLNSKEELNMPIVLFNGHLPDDVIDKVAKFITKHGYCSTIITLTDDIFRLNGKQIEYEDD